MRTPNNTHRHETIKGLKTRVVYVLEVESANLKQLSTTKIKHVPWPACKISLHPVIKWARNFDRAASFENNERLTEAKRTKHSRACHQKNNNK